MLASGGGIVAVVVLVLVNGFFVAAEFALVTTRRTRVEQLLAEGRVGAGNLQDAVVHLDSYIAACQLGITMASLALGWVGEPALAGLFEPLVGPGAGHAFAVGLSFVIITMLHVMAGELAPKGMALQYPERVALFVSGPLRAFRAVFRPAIWLLNEGGWMVARLIGVQRDVAEHPRIGAEELRLVVQASAESGAIETGEQFLLERVLKFGDLVVSNIMVPRTEVIALHVDISPAAAADVVREHHFSRYPVYRKGIDDLVGVLHVRDLMLHPDVPSLAPLLREPLVIPSHVRLDHLLTEMRARRSHFAVAIDEFGGIDGIVTLEDVLEAIVGDVSDEFGHQELTRRGPEGRIRIDGLDNVDVLDELLDARAEEGPYNTVGGYMMERIGRIPRVGDTVELGSYRLVVREMDDLRIAVVEAVPLPAGTPGTQREEGPGARV